MTVEPPASYEIPDSGEDYDNNFSLITTVELGENRLVFTGDIEEERISQWLESGKVKKCDVLKIPHHGLYNEPLEELVGIMQPSYAVICDSEKNPAEKETVSMLEEKGAQCLQTKNGDITIVCDGENIEPANESNESRLSPAAGQRPAARNSFRSGRSLSISARPIS